MPPVADRESRCARRTRLGEARAVAPEAAAGRARRSAHRRAAVVAAPAIVPELVQRVRSTTTKPAPIGARDQPSGVRCTCHSRSRCVAADGARTADARPDATRRSSRSARAARLGQSVTPDNVVEPACSAPSCRARLNRPSSNGTVAPSATTPLEPGRRPSGSTSTAQRDERPRPRVGDLRRERKPGASDARASSADALDGSSSNGSARASPSTDADAGTLGAARRSSARAARRQAARARARRRSAWRAAASSTRGSPSASSAGTSIARRRRRAAPSGRAAARRRVRARERVPSSASRRCRGASGRSREQRRRDTRRRQLAAPPLTRVGRGGGRTSRHTRSTNPRPCPPPRGADALREHSSYEARLRRVALEGKRIFITGGAGFIATTLARELVDAKRDRRGRQPPPRRALGHGARRAPELHVPPRRRARRGRRSRSSRAARRTSSTAPRSPASTP